MNPLPSALSLVGLSSVCQLQAKVRGSGSVSYLRGSTQAISTDEHRVPLALRVKQGSKLVMVPATADSVLARQLSKRPTDRKEERDEQ